MTSITFRLSEQARKRLKAKARSLRMTESDLLRDIVDRELVDRPWGERIGHLKGVVALPKQPRDWRKTLRERNWRE